MGVKPQGREVALLLALQVGLSALGAGVLALLPFEIGSGSWIPALGIMVGAQSFVMINEKRRPGRVRAFSHQLAVWAAIGQIALAILLGAVVLWLAPDVAAPVREAGGWLVVIGVVAAAAAYGLTRLGLRMGQRALERVRARKIAPPGQ